MKERDRAKQAFVGEALIAQPALHCMRVGNQRAMRGHCAFGNAGGSASVLIDGDVVRRIHAGRLKGQPLPARQQILEP